MTTISGWAAWNLSMICCIAGAFASSHSAKDRVTVAACAALIAVSDAVARMAAPNTPRRNLRRDEAWWLDVSVCMVFSLQDWQLRNVWGQHRGGGNRRSVWP